MIKARPSYALLIVTGVAAALATPAAQRGEAPATTTSLNTPLAATAHAPIAKDPFRLWLAPVESSSRRASTASFSAAAKLFSEAKYADVIPLLSGRFDGTPLADYAEYYRGLAQLRLSRAADARQTFTSLLTRPLAGYLSEAVRLRAAETAEALGDPAGAAALYNEVLKGTPVSPADVLLNLARVSQAAANTADAQTALARVYYEFPGSDQAAIAQSQLDAQNAWQPLQPGSARYKLELGRAERLFASKKYAQALTGFDLVKPYASGDDEELVALRRAECDYYLKRFSAAQGELEPWIRSARRRAEAQFFYLTTTREAGQLDEYVRLARELVTAFPSDSWAQETLNNLATHYILVDDDDAAEGVFREILEKYPTSRHAERASWKAGWWAYRRGEYANAIRLFEDAATRFPRSDYRPSWLYWSGRAHDRLGEKDTALARYSLVIADYQNSYYGRLATKILDARNAEPVIVAKASDVDAQPAQTQELPPTHALIRLLIANELYGDAMNELQYAQRTWGDSSAIQATIALVYARTGELRRGINAMKRAYPQYIAAGGEKLPPEMLKVLFPLAYWPQIKKHSAQQGLDPYLIAALMAQESTFDADIKSHANAVGLMQVTPPTGRRYARKVGIRRFSPSMLTNPDINIRLGTAIFADLVSRYGGAHLALASYNAGETPVARWRAERPGIEQDEFIDDIPYPETQNYVRKIVGTAEDYRRLYGTLHAQPGAIVGDTGTSSESSVAPAKPSTSKKKVSSSKSKTSTKKKAPRTPTRKRHPK